MTLSKLLCALAVAQTLAVCATAAEFRTIDGTNNNLSAPGVGAVGTTLSRWVPANYADGLATVDNSRPNARHISNQVFQQSGTLPDPRNLSEMAWAWGQFIDHDIDHTLNSTGNGQLQITIPAGDPIFDNGTTNLGGQNINLTRSNYTGGVTGPREQVNNISAWLDGSMVYGGRAADGPGGVDRAAFLRSGVGGKLNVSDGGALGDLLPVYQHGISPVMANTHRPTMAGASLGSKAFVAGDVRANEHAALTSLHTLFVREHNRLTDVLASEFPALDDEQLYQRARKIVGAQIQAITYDQYLPSLGVTVASYTGYDEAVDPSIRNEFSNAAFRMGHSQINGVMLRLNADGSTVAQGHLNLADSFFSPDFVRETGLEPILRGLTAQVQEATDAKLVDDLRNQLFQVFIPGMGLVDNATDLAAINITRGRDHGLGTYNQTRAALGLPPATSVSDITSDVTLQTALDDVYDSVDDIDLYVGLLSEDLTGASVGPTTAMIMADQFKRLRDGDRFWYQHGLDDHNSDLMAVAAWGGDENIRVSDWLGDLSLSDIIRLNTDADLPDNPFFAAPVPEPNPGLTLLCGMMIVVSCCRSRRV